MYVHNGLCGVTKLITLQPSVFISIFHRFSHAHPLLKIKIEIDTRVLSPLFISYVLIMSMLFMHDNVHGQQLFLGLYAST